MVLHFCAARCILCILWLYYFKDRETGLVQKLCKTRKQQSPCLCTLHFPLRILKHILLLQHTHTHKQAIQSSQGDLDIMGTILTKHSIFIAFWVPLAHFPVKAWPGGDPLLQKKKKKEGGSSVLVSSSKMGLLVSLVLKEYPLPGPEASRPPLQLLLRKEVGDGHIPAREAPCLWCHPHSDFYPWDWSTLPTPRPRELLSHCVGFLC